MSLNPHNFPSLAQPVAVTNLPESQKVEIQNLNLDSQYNLKVVNNTKGLSTLFNGSQTGINGTSFVCNLSDKNISNLTIYGQTSAATVLTVQFSNNNTTYYDSMYSYTVSSAGSFGFSINASPSYVRIKSSADVLCTAFINFV